MALTAKFATVYQHTQAAASASWVIAHNLGLYPSIDVYINYQGGVQKILPMAITFDTVNQCTVTFSSARTGFATVA